ncbi:MAG TPA: cobalamin-dependent protein, partial [Puia sp.]|nr:cobalamin-dependent protein [Puia sp.]
MNKVLLFNPRAAVNKFRVPNSILQVAASIEGIFEWGIVDGNRELDPFEKIRSYLETGEYKYIGFTVMPGPQTKQAIPFARRIKAEFPNTVMIWGGYFPASHFKVILESGYVDFVINGPGDRAFPELITTLERQSPVDLIRNLIYLRDGKVIKTPKEELIDQSSLPPLPYDRLDSFYPMEKYLGKTFLGNKTLAYHSSIG